MQGDAPALGRVMVASWLSGHKGHMPDELWVRRAADWTPEVSAQGWARVLDDQTSGGAPRDVLLVAEEPAAWLVGLVYGRPADDDPALTAEVSALYVDATRRRQGVGAALLQVAALELRQLGFSTVRLEVLSANLPARAFYEQLGGREIGHGTFDEDGYPLDVTIYQWAISHLAT
ncbi:hypothetical protein CFI00_10500 [Nocardioides sp. S5]|nr:hypothetical protein CFI00_10500 [Nocardioides sp. S5]